MSVTVLAISATVLTIYVAMSLTLVVMSGTTVIETAIDSENLIYVPVLARLRLRRMITLLLLAYCKIVHSHSSCHLGIR